MRNNHSEDKTSQSTEPQNTVPDVDVTAVFRPVGLPQTVTASAGFEAKYRLLDCQGDRTDHCDIIWGVRCALSGCLPTRSLRARHGDALRLDLPSFQQGVCEEIGIVIHSSANHVHLMLPGEFHELSTCRLVVAESDREISRMVQMLLEGDGFEVTVTHSAAAALERIERGNFDLALLDADLPDLSAFILCARLRAAPATRNLPIVICSAWPDLGDRAAQSGAAGYLQKPFDFLNLAGRLWEFLCPQPTARTTHPIKEEPRA